MENNYAPPKSTVADVTQSSGSVTNEMVEQLRRTKPWALFIAILIFILAVLLMLGTGIVFLISVAAKAMNAPVGMGPVMLFVGIFIGILAVVHFMLGLHLTRFTSAIDRLIQSGDLLDMTDAMERQRKFWVLAAIVSILSTIFTAAYYAALIFMPSIKEMLNSVGSS